MVTMESVDMGAEHHMGSLSARDATYDELDQEREASLEQEGIEDIDEFLKDVQGNLKDNGGGTRRASRRWKNRSRTRSGGWLAWRCSCGKPSGSAMPRRRW